MPAYFEEGFFVNKPAWHELGTVLTEYPNREQAIPLAGHDFTIVERPFVIVGEQVPFESIADDSYIEQPHVTMPDGDIYYNQGIGHGWKVMVKHMPGNPTDGQVMYCGKDSYHTIQNTVGWDIADLVLGEDKKAVYDTAGVLKQGAQCWILLMLDEPIVIKGDDSPVLPYICITWAHDGTASLKVRSTTVRVVCANTESASEAEAEKNNTNFTFRHTKNYAERIEDAREAIAGMREQVNVFQQMANELARLRFPTAKREAFVHNLVPYPPEAITSVGISEQKARNIEDARVAVRRILDSPTVPVKHKGTGYGMHLAGVEFLDHLRGNRSTETRFIDSMIKNSSLKSRLRKLVHDVAEGKLDVDDKKPVLV